MYTIVDHFQTILSNRKEFPKLYLLATVKRSYAINTIERIPLGKLHSYNTFRHYDLQSFIIADYKLTRRDS